MNNEKALTFNKTSKMLANTSYEGAYLHLDSSFDQHQVKVVVSHNNQKFEMHLPIVLQDGVPMAKLSLDSHQNAEVEDEVVQFAQSIVSFHQDKDGYTLSPLNSHA
ncbi:hypothetical protein [Acinetobacter johnsonii]|uniref:hypothetical protein n=1 Tax=Acinetobacter johnsonii TaxID=40214 RepID=UPI001F4261CB|nr:hypothetical protein [Acinetobacter johnsonii]UIZ97752.1 hypothetical protein GBN68_07295 [Acinetobacter johnsonii]